MADRGWIQIEQADQHFADDAAADGAETIAAAPDVGFAKDVVPQRRFAGPSHFRCPDLIARKRPLAKQGCDRFARRQPDTLPALEVTCCQRTQLIHVGRAGDSVRQRDHRPDKASVEFLCALRMLLTVHVEQIGPVHSMLRSDWFNPIRSGKIGTAADALLT